MKKWMVLFLAGFGLHTAQGQHKLVELWETGDLPVPESVLHVPGKNILYVSLIDGDGSAKDGKGGLAILNTDGSIKDKNWVTGMNAPKGLGLYKELLYVADITDVAVVDVISGNEINRIAIPGSTFLNDVTVDDNGIVYVSDTREKKIFQLRNNKPTLFLDNVPNVNGLKAIGADLYVMAGPELWKVDSRKNKTVLAKGLALGGDGLEPIGNGDFLVSCWGGLIYYIHANGELETLLDVQGKLNTADIGYDSAKKILYVPTFNNNSVKAFQLK